MKIAETTPRIPVPMMGKRSRDASEVRQDYELRMTRKVQSVEESREGQSFVGSNVPQEFTQSPLISECDVGRRSEFQREFPKVMWSIDLSRSSPTEWQFEGHLAQQVLNDAILDGQPLKFIFKIHDQTRGSFVLAGRAHSHLNILGWDRGDAAGEVRLIRSREGNIIPTLISNKSGAFKPTMGSLEPVLTFCKAAMSESERQHIEFLVFHTSYEKNEPVLELFSMSGDELQGAIGQSESPHRSLLADHHHYSSDTGSLVDSIGSKKTERSSDQDSENQEGIFEMEL